MSDKLYKCTGEGDERCNAYGGTGRSGRCGHYGLHSFLEGSCTRVEYCPDIYKDVTCNCVRGNDTILFKRSRKKEKGNVHMS